MVEVDRSIFCFFLFCLFVVLIPYSASYLGPGNIEARDHKFHTSSLSSHSFSFLFHPLSSGVKSESIFNIRINFHASACPAN